jgi:DNA repair ATPase RecN
MLYTSLFDLIERPLSHSHSHSLNGMDVTTIVQYNPGENFQLPTYLKDSRLSANKTAKLYGDYQRLKTECESLKRELAELEQKKSTLERQYNELEAVHEKLQQSYTEITNSHKTLQERLAEATGNSLSMSPSLSLSFSIRKRRLQNELRKCCPLKKKLRGVAKFKRQHPVQHTILYFKLSISSSC